METQVGNKPSIKSPRSWQLLLPVLLLILILGALFSPFRRVSHQIVPPNPDLRSSSTDGADSVAFALPGFEGDSSLLDTNLRSDDLMPYLEGEPGFDEMVDISVLGEDQNRTRSLDLPAEKPNLEEGLIIKPEKAHPEGEFFLVAGTYDELHLAEQRLEELRLGNLPARLLLPIQSQEHIYRVVVYRHPYRQGALEKAKELERRRNLKTELYFWPASRP